MKSAIVFLTTIPNQATLVFAQRIKRELGHDVYVVIDNNKFKNDIVNDIIFIKAEESYCEKHGYINSNISDNATHIRKNPIAMDKFLLFFCVNDLPYEFIWVFEEDVFIQSIETLAYLDKRYSHYDLVTPNNFKKSYNGLDWHWKHIVDKIEPPYYYSMVSAMGLSKNMLECIKAYVDKHKSLFYIEAMFNTLAMHNGLDVIDPLELKSIVWMGEWGLDEFLQLPNNLFHPIKSINEHQILRDAIVQFRNQNYIPTNRLPDFILAHIN
jgi:hypothetical protein